MNQSQLTSLLESITGHFITESPEQEKSLREAQVKIAQSVLQKDDSGTEQLFASPGFYSREKINPSVLKNISSISSEAFAQPQPDDLRVFVRTVPVRSAGVAGSMPDWAVGVKPAESYGPFLNNEGRQVWIDIYKVVKLVTFYLGTQPVLLFKTTFLRTPIPGNPELKTAYTINPGSIWINARLLSSSAPADKFVGIRVSGGTLKLSALPTLVAAKITLSALSNISLDLKPVQQPDDGAAELSGYGKDARDSTYKMPDSLSINWNALSKKVDALSAGGASALIYGQALDFSMAATPNPAIVYNDFLNAVLIPWTASSPTFAIVSCQSPFMTVSGTAPILASYWSLPAATIDITSPLEAEGSGGVLIQCDSGLRAAWSNLQHEDVRLQKPMISASPGLLFIIDLSSNQSGASQHFDLWQDPTKTAPSTADILFLKNAPYLYHCSSEKSQEMLTTICDAEFKADRPVKVNGEAFALRSKSSALLLSASDARKLVYLYDDSLITDNLPKANPAFAAPPPFKTVAIALENAVFTVSPAASVMLFGECNESWQKVVRANFFVSFYLYRYLPTLPDPYVGNLRTWERLFGGRDANFAVAGARGVPSMMLICAVRYAVAADLGDDIKTSFHFGTLTPGNLLELPQPAQGAPMPEGQADRAVAIKSAPIGSIKTGVKINAASIAKSIEENDAMLGRLLLKPEAGIFSRLEQDPVLSTTKTGDDLIRDLAVSERGHKYEDLWDSSLFGNRLNAEPFALLDVSSNANQMGISVSGQMIIVKTGRVVPGANNENATVQANGFPFIVDGMEVMSPANLVRSFTLPQVSWEPVSNLSSPDRVNEFDPNSAKLPLDPDAGFLYFADDGGPSRTWNNSTAPVPLAPIPVISSLIEDFQNNPKNYTVSAFTLPFGLKAISYISKNFTESEKPDISLIRPRFRENEDGSHKLVGGIQLRLEAGNFGKSFPDPAEDDSDMFPGYIVQLNNLLNPLGLPSGASMLGQRVTEIFNNEFLIGALSISTKLQDSRGVPVSRMDVTGYGANMFSNWLSPTAAMAQTSQSRFDVLMGRTSHEVIQVKSILYPWGIRVVRTITLFRNSAGFVYRVDSGWKAQSDGLFDFSYRYKILNAPPNTRDPAFFATELEPYQFHPGVIKGLYNVRNIKDAPAVAEFNAANDIPAATEFLNGIKGQRQISGAAIHEPVKCGGVYFDADIEIENVVQGHTNRRVVSKKVLGYVQVAPAGKPLTPGQLRDLLALQGNSIGGDIDCVLDINNSDQQMRINRFDVNASVDAGGDPVFVVAARGNVFLPKDGSWSMVQHNAGTGDVTPLPTGITVPLIRTGKWKKGSVIDPAVVASSLLRIAHPLEILRAPGTATINFGYLQSTATQKALFLTPAYGNAVKMMLSKTPPVFADAYRLMTGNGIFPNVGNAIDNFGKNMPLLNGKDSAGQAAQAFVKNALKDGGTNVFELMQVQAEKAGEAVVKQGMSMLQKGANGLLDKALKFDVPSFEIPLVDTESLRIYIAYQTGKKDDPPADYIDSKLNFDVDSFAGDMGKQWKSRLNNLAMIVDLGEMKKLMTIKGNFDASKGKESGYEGGEAGNGLPVPEIEFSEALQPVIEILTILSQLSTGKYGEAMKKGLKLAMSNSGEIWEYKFEATKDIPIVRFPPLEEAYNSAQTPLKLEASLGLGVYFNAALKVTTDPGQLLPTAGAFLKFHGGLSVMCFSVGVGSIYAIGSVDVKIACDTKVGPNLTLAFGFGVQLVVSLPVVGNVSVTYMIGLEMYVDKDIVIISAMMLFRGHAELLGGLVTVTILIEAKGIVKKTGTKTEASAQVTFAIDISIFLIIDISFSKTWGESKQIA